MALFHYKGRNQQGEVVTGDLEANSTSDMAAHLINIGITPIDIHETEAESEDALASLKNLFSEKKPGLDELLIFSHQMSTLLKAGIPILSALKGLQGHITHQGLAVALGEIAADLENGRTLSAAMQRHATIFPTLFVSMVNVGENTGRLDQAFLQLHSYLELERETRDQIKSATRYPMFVIAALVTAMVIINLFVIPAFSNVFSGLGSDLPWATQLLISTSTFTLNYWPYLLILLVIAGFSARAYLKTEQGLYQWDRYKLRLPLVGSIIERAILSRFCRSFSMAFRSGLPITQTLSVVSKAVDNTYLEQRIISMRDGLEHGESLTQTAITSNLFTPLVLQMISVGEETGSVDDMLDEVAIFYEREVDFDTKKLSSAIEPILISVIGIMVLILALGIFLPMWDLGSAAIT